MNKLLDTYYPQKLNEDHINILNRSIMSIIVSQKRKEQNLPLNFTTPLERKEDQCSQTHP
jgi:hypothetical protein